MNPFVPWSTTAINLPDHADNLIHTDAGAQAAGFERALVAGTTVYAYLTHLPVTAWGDAWLSGGGCELRLRRPVFDNELVDCVGAERDDALWVDALVGGDARASIRVIEHADPLPQRDGEAMRPLEVELSQDHIDYGVRSGDDLTLYTERAIAPPVTWANLANSVFMDNLVTGPWIHVRSLISHEGLAPLGSTIRIESKLIDRFDSRAGERAIVDMVVTADGERVASIEHEAVITLP